MSSLVDHPALRALGCGLPLRSTDQSTAPSPVYSHLDFTGEYLVVSGMDQGSVGKGALAEKIVSLSDTLGALPNWVETGYVLDCFGIVFGNGTFSSLSEARARGITWLYVRLDSYSEELMGGAVLLKEKALAESMEIDSFYQFFDQDRKKTWMTSDFVGAELYFPEIVGLASWCIYWTADSPPQEGLGVEKFKELLSLPCRPPVYSADRVTEFTEWNGLYCRSVPEEVIAKELERRGINFMLNPGGRFTIGDTRKTREPDFLVFLGEGKTAILEVDGEQYHQSAAADHDRDRIFRKMGILVDRFPASRCLKDPKGVVDDFLDCMK